MFMNSLYIAERKHYPIYLEVKWIVFHIPENGRHPVSINPLYKPL